MADPGASCSRLSRTWGALLIQPPARPVGAWELPLTHHLCTCLSPQVARDECWAPVGAAPPSAQPGSSLSPATSANVLLATSRRSVLGCPLKNTHTHTHTLSTLLPLLQNSLRKFTCSQASTSLNLSLRTWTPTTLTVLAKVADGLMHRRVPIPHLPDLPTPGFQVTAASRASCLAGRSPSFLCCYVSLQSSQCYGTCALSPHATLLSFTPTTLHVLRATPLPKLIAWSPDRSELKPDPCSWNLLRSPQQASLCTAREVESSGMGEQGPGAAH